MGTSQIHTHVSVASRDVTVLSASSVAVLASLRHACQGTRICWHIRTAEERSGRGTS